MNRTWLMLGAALAVTGAALVAQARPKAPEQPPAGAPAAGGAH